MSRFSALIDDVKPSSSTDRMKKSNNKRRDDKNNSHKDQLDTTKSCTTINTDASTNTNQRMDTRPKRDNMYRTLNKRTAQAINITQEDEFPELSKTHSVIQKEKTSTTWLEAIRQQEENSQNETAINQYDPKYWNGAMWIGPMLMRQAEYPADWYVYIENAIKGNASSFLVPYRRTEFSRDGKNWYTSWDDTFTDEQLQQIQEEEEYIVSEERRNILEEYRKTQCRISAKYYEEIGEFDDYTVARLERLAYEKYAEQFEQVEEEEVYDNEELEETDDYLEEDN